MKDILILGISIILLIFFGFWFLREIIEALTGDLRVIWLIVSAVFSYIFFKLVELQMR